MIGVPIYCWHCASCGHEWDKLMKMSDERPDCPKCEAVDVRKMVSHKTGFILKGTGWYRDHYGLKTKAQEK